MASTSAPFPGVYASDWPAFEPPTASPAGTLPTSTADPFPSSPGHAAAVDQYDPFSPSIANWQGGYQGGQQQGGGGGAHEGNGFGPWSAGHQQGGIQATLPINLPQLDNNLAQNQFDQQYHLPGHVTPQAELQPGSLGGAHFDASWLPLHAGDPGWGQPYSPPAELSSFGHNQLHNWNNNQLGQASFASMADGRIQTALAQAGLGASAAPHWPPVPPSASTSLYSPSQPQSHDTSPLTLAQMLAAHSTQSISPDFTFTSSASSTPLYTPTDRSHSSPAVTPAFPLSPTNTFGSSLSATYPLYPEANLAGSFSALLPPTTAGLSPSSASASTSASPPAGAAPPSRRGTPSSSPPPQAIPVVDPHHPAIARVAANRIRSGLNKASSPDADPLAAPTPGVVKEKAGKVTLEVQAKCGSCGKVVAILSCRGKREDLARPHRPEYLCLECSPKRDEFEEEEPVEEGDRELKYATTISAVLDQLAGLELAKDEARPRAKPAGIGRRRRTEQEGLPCDVCARILGSGMTVDAQTREAVGFAVEVICPRCASRYKRCSDCGGGGGDGGRIGPGRWRSKELFEPGRKVCKFSHRRQGPSDNMLYETWSLAEINALPPEQGAELRVLLRTTYVTFMLATLAIPEQLEAPGALARNFTECLKINEDHWAAFESVLAQDIEEATGIRRYIGLRWSLATVRKAPKDRDKDKAAGAGGAGEVAEGVPEPYPDGKRVLIPQGRILASFSAGEIELGTGSMFQSLNFPKGIGEVYDQGSIVIQKMIVRIERDIAELNAERVRSGLEGYPRLGVIWGMYMYKRSIPFLSRRGERRGFKLLDDYLALHPEDRGLFPPARPCYVPVELLAGWEITARRWSEGDDLSIPQGRNRRVDRAARGAKVEEVY